MFNSIGERIVYCRGILGYSRKEFAEQMNGISLPTLSRWELNYVRIPDKQLDKLVVFFNENSDGSGCKGEYKDSNSESYKSNQCYVNGVLCIAEEARFGGIVIQKQ